MFPGGIEIEDWLEIGLTKRVTTALHQLFQVCLTTP